MLYQLIAGTMRLRDQLADNFCNEKFAEIQI